MGDSGTPFMRCPPQMSSGGRARRLLQINCAPARRSGRSTGSGGVSGGACARDGSRAAAVGGRLTFFARIARVQALRTAMRALPSHFLSAAKDRRVGCIHPDAKVGSSSKVRRSAAGTLRLSRSGRCGVTCSGPRLRRARITQAAGAPRRGQLAWRGALEHDLHGHLSVEVAACIAGKCRDHGIDRRPPRPADSAGVNTAPGFARRTLREMAASVLESTVRRGRASGVADTQVTSRRHGGAGQSRR